ncbi:hypothetical protein ACIQNU_20625 [Streptomyces sp. NPDC091292]|uniref:hypothetical protein n=1 Tax=Streptomyces sp. NPDC091292 TaxID=3365991 RepID=UPI00380827FD
MTDPDHPNPHFPEYRAQAGSPMGLGAPGIGLVGITFGLAQLARNGAPLWVLLGLPVVLAVLLGGLWLAAKRTATLTGPKNIVVQGPLAHRVTAWQDVQAIEVVSNAAGVADAKAVREYVVVYDRTGRATMLPHLNDKTVFSVEEEVRQLRELWERLRGDDWAPLPEVAAKVARAHRRSDRARAWIVSVMVAGGSAVLTGLLIVALVLSGALDDVDGVLGDVLSPMLILVVPLLVCPMTYLLIRSRDTHGTRNADIP